MPNKRVDPKPCPFCTCVDVLIGHTQSCCTSTKLGQQYFAYCITCSAQGPWSGTPNGALASWNVRFEDGGRDA